MDSAHLDYFDMQGYTGEAEGTTSAEHSALSSKAGSPAPVQSDLATAQQINFPPALHHHNAYDDDAAMSQQAFAPSHIGGDALASMDAGHSEQLHNTTINPFDIGGHVTPTHHHQADEDLHQDAVEPPAKRKKLDASPPVNRKTSVEPSKKPKGSTSATVTKTSDASSTSIDGKKASTTQSTQSKTATTAGSGASKSSAKVTKNGKEDASQSNDPDPWERALPPLRELLSERAFVKTPKSTSQKIARLLQNFATTASSRSSTWGDTSEVPPAGRDEVLKAILRYGTPAFLASWCEDAERGGGLEIMQAWLVGAQSSLEGKGKGRNADLRPTLISVVQVLNRLPFTWEVVLKFKKLGASITKVKTICKDPEISQIATEIRDKFEQLHIEHGLKADSNPKSTTAAKEAPAKRKADNVEGATKKPKVTPAATPAPPVAPAASAASAPKPQPLPSFKRAGKKAEPGAPVPSTTPTTSANVFQDARIALLNRAKVPAANAGTTSASGVGGKPRKSVRWAEGPSLEMIKIIERAVYDDEDEQSVDDDDMAEIGAAENARMMNEQEGQAMKHADEIDDDPDELEEEIDWYEPADVEVPQTEEFRQLRNPDFVNSALLDAFLSSGVSMDSIVYNESVEPPPTADERAVAAGEAGETKLMSLSQDLIDDSEVQLQIQRAQASSPPTGGFTANDQIQSLLGQLSASGFIPPGQSAHEAPASQNGPSGGQVPPQHSYAEQSVFNQATLDALRGFDSSIVQQIAQENPGMSERLQVLSHGQFPGSHSFAQPQPQSTSTSASASAWDRALPPHMSGVPTWQQNSNNNLVTPYNGYVPPAQPQTGASGPRPTNDQNHDGRGGGGGGGGRGKKTRRGTRGGKRLQDVCKFFAHRRGCNRGDDCMFQHEGADGVDVRDR